MAPVEWEMVYNLKVEMTGFAFVFSRGIKGRVLLEKSSTFCPATQSQSIQANLFL